MQPYLPELMECMLQPLKTPSKARTKELAVSAIGAIGEPEDRGAESVAWPRARVGSPQSCHL